MLGGKGERRKEASRGPFRGPRMVNWEGAIRNLKTPVQNAPKMEPEVQNAPKMEQKGPNMEPIRAKMEPKGPNLAQNGAERVPENIEKSMPEKRSAPGRPLPY